MAAVRGHDTKPELLLRRTMWAMGVRGWRVHRRDLPGTPDLAFGRVRLAVFVDGAFWHGRSMSRSLLKFGDGPTSYAAS